MKYTIGECLADNSFMVLEKLHEPIALLDRCGQVVKMNEAARKLLRIARVTQAEMEKFLSASAIFGKSGQRFGRVLCGKRQIVARHFNSSGYVLVEMLTTSH